MPARGTVEQEPACAVQTGPQSALCLFREPKCKFLLNFKFWRFLSGMDSKDSSPKTVLPLVCLTNLHAGAPQPGGRRAACGHCGDVFSENFNFFKLNTFTFPKELLK